jgi:folate-binding protein YgfZ
MRNEAYNSQNLINNISKAPFYPQLPNGFPGKPMQSFYLDPSHFERISVSGSDAERFLQGQVTCDVAALDENTFTYGAVCTNKGRVITPFLLGKHGDGFQLVFGKDLGKLFMTALKKFLPFYKCKMELLDASHSCIGLAGPESAGILQAQQLPMPTTGSLTPFDGGWIAMLSLEPLQFLVCPDVSGTALQQADMKTLERDDGTRWQAQLMQHGHFPFSVADSEHYTAQDLHYDRKGYVSFTKGCYTGQEIVARMHYRGKIKKQFYLVKLPSSAELHDPVEVTLIDDSGAERAHCIKIVRLDAHDCLGLAELPLELAEQQTTLTTREGTRAELAPF